MSFIDRAAGGYRLAFYRPGVRASTGFTPSALQTLDETAFSRYVNKMITLELF